MSECDIIIVNINSLREEKNKNDSDLKLLQEENIKLKDQIRILECNINKMDRLAYGKLVLKFNKELPKEID